MAEGKQSIEWELKPFYSKSYIQSPQGCYCSVVAVLALNFSLSKIEEVTSPTVGLVGEAYTEVYIEQHCHTIFYFYIVYHTLSLPDSPQHSL